MACHSDTHRRLCAPSAPRAPPPPPAPCAAAPSASPRSPARASVPPACSRSTRAPPGCPSALPVPRRSPRRSPSSAPPLSQRDSRLTETDAARLSRKRDCFGKETAYGRSRGWLAVKTWERHSRSWSWRDRWYAMPCRHWEVARVHWDERRATRKGLWRAQDKLKGFRARCHSILRRKQPYPTSRPYPKEGVGHRV